MKSEIVINGIKVDAAMLMSLFLLAFDPDEDKWYRFVKNNGELMIQEAIEKESANKNDGIIQ